VFPQGLGELARSLHYPWQRPFPSRAMGLRNLTQTYSKKLLWTSTPSLSPQSSTSTAPGRPWPKPPAWSHTAAPSSAAGLLGSSGTEGLRTTETKGPAFPFCLVLSHCSSSPERSLQSWTTPAPDKEKSMRPLTDGWSHQLSHQELEAEPREPSQGFKGQLAKLFPDFCML